MSVRHARSSIAVALAACAATALPAGTAHAGHREKTVVVEHRGEQPGAVKRHWRHGYRYDRIRYVAVRRPGAFVLRPTAPGCFVVRHERYLQVRPVPYWSVPYRSGTSAHVAFRTGGGIFDLSFSRRRPYYGCNFCAAYFPTYAGWERHVLACWHRPRTRIVVERWDEGDADYFGEIAEPVCSQYDAHYQEWDEGDDDDHHDDDDE